MFSECSISSEISIFVSEKCLRKKRDCVIFWLDLDMLTLLFSGLRAPVQLVVHLILGDLIH